MTERSFLRRKPNVMRKIVFMANLLRHWLCFIWFNVGQGISSALNGGELEVLAEFSTVAQQVKTFWNAEIVVRLRPRVKTFLEFLAVVSWDETFKVRNSNIQTFFKHFIVWLVQEATLFIAFLFVGDKERWSSLWLREWRRGWSLVFRDYWWHCIEWFKSSISSTLILGQWRSFALFVKRHRWLDMVTQQGIA